LSQAQLANQYPNASEASQRALQILRDPTHFEWYVVPIFVIVLYFYFCEVKQKNWHVVAAGLAYYGIEWIGEILNSLIFHFSGFAPLWGEPGKTAYLILMGINIETTLMFGIFGLGIAKLLPEDKKIKWYGINARFWVAGGVCLLAALVESTLNAWGALTWDYWWWGWPHIWSVILFAYLPATLFAILFHDMENLKLKFKLLGTLFVLDIFLFWLLVCQLRLI